LVIAGSLLVATPAQAVTQHRDSSLFPNKVELSGDDSTFDTNLGVGTYVRLKVGTKVTTKPHTFQQPRILRGCCRVGSRVALG